MITTKSEDPLNIAFVLNYYGVECGGPVEVALNLAREFIGKGHEVSYWAPVYDKRTNQESPIEGLKLRLFDGGWPRSWARSSALTDEFRRSVENVDVIHMMDFWGHPIWACSRIARQTGTPSVLRPAGALNPRRVSRKYWKKKPYLEVLGRGILRRASCVQACSDQEKRHLRASGYDGRMQMIPNGISAQQFRDLPCKSIADETWPELRRKRVVLFMGRIAPEKGFDVLVPAWAEYLKRVNHGGSVLVIAGPDREGYKGKVLKWMNQYGVRDSVVFVGTVSGDEKLALYNRADVFILPSYSENFGIVVPEAMASRTPVITTTGTPWHELEELEIGRYVAPEPEPLSEALQELLGLSDGERRDMGERARAYVFEHYEWGRISERILDLYRSLI
ncbi:MAG: glycosyltransferase [Candidatus Brocadiia bacterium]